MVDTETIKLKFDGKDAEFEIKEHLSFGDVESLMDKCATVDEETGQN